MHPPQTRLSQSQSSRQFRRIIWIACHQLPRMLRPHLRRPRRPWSRTWSRVRSRAVCVRHGDVLVATGSACRGEGEVEVARIVEELRELARMCASLSPPRRRRCELLLRSQ